MNRTQKESFVKDLHDGISQAQAFALLSFSNLTVEQMTSFRLSLKKSSIDVKVVKNTLAKRVLSDSPYQSISDQLKGPTLLVYGSGDPVTTAKAITEWANKENFDIKLKAGVALGKVISVEQMKALSSLPGRNEMLVSFLWALKSHPTRFLYALQDAPKRLGYALGALKNKKENEGTNA